jgi:ubiquinone/menaquinone biosynthesis C-methylase UbiE
MMTTITDHALKGHVRDHWEEETCGVRYADSQDRLTWFRQVADNRYKLEPYISSFARFPEARGKWVLEIGVGAGTDFLQWCRQAQHATGIDLTEAGIALTRERLLLEGMPESRFSLKTADAEALPFPNNSFDIVYSWGVLHHTPRTDVAYNEVHRVLRPGGTMRTMIYHVPSWTALMLWINHALTRGRIGLSLKDVIYRHLESPGTKAYTLDEAKHLVETTGFRDVHVTSRLGPGDLLQIKASRRYQGFFARLAWAVYPRLLVRLLGDRFGLYLLIEGKKALPD